MTDLVIDTHAAIWYFAGAPQMSAAAERAIDEAIAGNYSVILPTISIVEIVYLIDKGKLFSQNLNSLMQNLNSPNSGFITQDLTANIAQTLARVPRAVVPDMPDRIIAATALHLNLPLITKDAKIRALPSIQLVW